MNAVYGTVTCVFALFSVIFIVLMVLGSKYDTQAKYSVMCQLSSFVFLLIRSAWWLLKMYFYV